MRLWAVILILGLLVTSGIATSNAQQPAKVPDPTQKRTVSRGVLGVNLQELNKDLRDRWQVPDNRGVLITVIGKDSAAERGGIQANDVIVRYHGQDVTDLVALQDRVAATAPGTKVAVVVLRAGKEQTLDVTVGERQEVLPSLNDRLHDAVKNNNFAEARAAIAEGANIDSEGWGKKTPLRIAAKNGRIKMVKLLLEKGADINAADNSGNTPLMLAAKSVAADLYGGEYAEVVELLLEKGAWVNASDKDGDTALHWAVASDSELDRVAMVKLLLAKGADINAKGSGWTPLLSASYKGHTEIVGLLLEKGADIKFQDRDGFNVLHYAKEQGHKEIEQLLLAKGTEEARRRLDRSQAAVEMAKSPEDYDRAIKELAPAIQLAPHLPEPYYNLALLQEKQGQYAAAIANLKEYVRLAPQASDVEKVRSHINRLEYKHEQDRQARTIDSIDALVTGVSFYESGYDGTAIGKRSYASRFARTKMRYAYWELALEIKNPIWRGQPREFAVEAVWFSPAGQELYRATTKSRFEPGWENVFLTSGFGWKQAATAQWSPGTYRVDLYVKGKKVATGEFVME